MARSPLLDAAWDEWRGPSFASSPSVAHTPLLCSDNEHSSALSASDSPSSTVSSPPTGRCAFEIPPDIPLSAIFPGYSMSLLDMPSRLPVDVDETMQALGLNEHPMCTAESLLQEPAGPSYTKDHTYYPQPPPTPAGLHGHADCDNMLGLYWTHSGTPLPDIMHSPTPISYPTGLSDFLVHRFYKSYKDEAIERDIVPTPPVGSNRLEVQAISPSPEVQSNARANYPCRIPRTTRKLTSSTSRSLRQAIPTARHPPHNTLPYHSPASSSSSERSPAAHADDTLYTYKSRQTKGSGTPNFASTTPSGDFQCETCDKVYQPNRSSDFQRHVLTHYPEYRGGAILCCGYPLEQGLALISEGVIPANAPVRRYYGQLMVGGCGLLCCRPDVLRKHLRNGRNTCVGDLNGPWHPPRLSKRK